MDLMAQEIDPSIDADLGYINDGITNQWKRFIIEKMVLGQMVNYWKKQS